VLHAQGDLAGAFSEQRANLEIMTRLPTKDPANSEWRDGVIVGRGWVGRALLAQGELAGALNEFQAEVAILEQLVDKIIQMIPSAFEDFREVSGCCEGTNVRKAYARGSGGSRCCGK
jgi:hypothetical protein